MAVMTGAGGQTSGPGPLSGENRLQDPSLPSADMEGLELFQAQCVCPGQSGVETCFILERGGPSLHVLDGAGLPS